jgi:hypothetical protein
MRSSDEEFEKRVKEMDAQLLERIQKYGYTFVAVGSSQTTPNFTYTVGLAKKGFPEIVLFGLEPQTAMTLIVSIVREWEDNGAHRIGIYKSLIETKDGVDCDCEINLVTSEEVIEKYCKMTRYVVGIQNYNVAQLTVGDEQGRSISHPDYDNSRLNQFILPKVAIQ